MPSEDGMRVRDNLTRCLDSMRQGSDDGDARGSVPLDPGPSVTPVARRTAKASRGDGVRAPSRGGVLWRP